MSSNFIPTCLYSQSSQMVLMSKNIQYDHSDESVVAKMSETEKAIERCQDEMKQIIKDIQSTMRREINWAEQRMDNTIQHLETQLKIWNKDLK